MKDSYTIHEIAALYGVGPDALRYYEQLGLVRPRRAQNGYRIYDLNDIYRLTILRDLRSLGFSMERIGEYLKDLSVANTLQLLDEERRLIREKMRALRAAESAIRERVRHLQACAAVEDGEHLPCGTAAAALPAPQRRHRPRRGDGLCHQAPAPPPRGHHPRSGRAEDRRQHRPGGHTRRAGGRVPLGVLPIRGRRSGRLHAARAGATRAFSTAAATGSWAGASRRCFPGRGREGLSPTGDVLELYHIDNRFTAREEEFLTELQVRVEPAEEETGEMTTDEIMLFDKWPDVLPLYARPAGKTVCGLPEDDAEGGEDAGLLPQPPCIRHGIAAVAAAARRAGGTICWCPSGFPIGAIRRACGRAWRRTRGAGRTTRWWQTRAGSGRRTAGAHRRGLSLRHGQVTGPFAAEPRPLRLEAR